MTSLFGFSETELCICHGEQPGLTLLSLGLRNHSVYCTGLCWSWDANCEVTNVQTGRTWMKGGKWLPFYAFQSFVGENQQHNSLMQKAKLICQALCFQQTNILKVPCFLRPFRWFCVQIRWESENRSCKLGKQNFMELHSLMFRVGHQRQLLPYTETH